MRVGEMSPKQREMQAWCRELLARPVPDHVLQAMADYRARRAAGVILSHAMRQALRQEQGGDGA
jgi:hypothetical protein